MTLKAAGLQTYYQSLMEIPPGALLKANNSIINREGVIESRRGIKAYNSGDNLLPAQAKQMFEYKGRILAHLQNNTLVYDNGSAVFAPFYDKEITEVVVTTTPTASSYLVLNSALNTRKYVIWFDTTGTAPEPTVSGTFEYFKIDISAAPSTQTIASLITATININIPSYFTATVSSNIVTITNSEVGASIDATSSAHPDPVSNLTVSVITQGGASPYIEPVSGYRMRSAESKGNFYFTTTNGVQRISAKTAEDLSSIDAIQQSGVPKGISGTTRVDYSTSGFLSNNQKTGYIIVWTYTDKQGTSMRGAPSATMTAENKSIVTDSSAVILNFQIPEGITQFNYTSYKFAICRTDATTLTGTLANEYRQIFERSPAFSEITGSRTIQYTDTISESLRIGGEPLYTNTANGSGLLSANERPPAARDIALFSGHMFYANTRTPHATTCNLLTTTGFSSGISDLVISNGITTNSYTFQGQKQTTQISVGASTTLASIKDGDYFTLNSAGNERKYTVWMDKTTNGAVSQSSTFTVNSLPTGATREATSVTVNTTLPVGSAREVTSVTVSSTPTASSYLVLNSALDAKKYVIWFDRTGTDLQPTVSGTFNYVRVAVLGSPTTATIAGLINTAINTNINLDFTSTVSTNIVTITNVGAGAVTDAVSSTSPAANLVVSVTTQGRESSYFVINSALNQRRYVIWFDRTGTDLQPTVSGTFDYLRIVTGAAPTNITIATAIHNAINANISSDFTSTYTAGTAVVTITATVFGATTDSFQSTNPSANLTISTTAQGSTSSYFVIYSALNQRKYVVWFDRSGSDLQPTVSGTFAYVRVITGLAPTTATIAAAISTQIAVNASLDFVTSVSSNIVTITNSASGPTIDPFQSTVPTANLTINVTAQGTGPLPGTIPLRVYLPATATTAAAITSAIETAIKTSLGPGPVGTTANDFITTYTAGSTSFTVSTENNGAAEATPGSEFTSNTTAAEVRTVTVTATYPAASSYFIINSANQRQYVVWFDRLGTDPQPSVAGTYAYIRVFIGAAPASTSAVATAIFNALNVAPITSDFTFSVSGAVVTITNTQTNFVVDSTQSTSPAASLTITTTVQGSGNWIFSTTLQTGSGEDIANKKILISGKLDLVSALEDMAKSIVRVINSNPDESVIAYYASTSGTTPGKILLQSKNLQDVNFFVGTSDTFIAPKFLPELGTIVQNTNVESLPDTTPYSLIDTTSSFSFIPGDTVLIYGASSTITSSAPSLNGKKTVYQTIPSTNQYSIQQDVSAVTNAGYTMTAKLMSTAETVGNRIYYSKHQQPESVPVLNYEDVGSKDQEILRIIALRESLYVFKNDGIFKISGEGGPTPFFKASIYDNTAILKAPDTVVALGNQCYFYGNQGIVRLGDASMESISRPIEDKVIPFLKSNPNLSTAAFAVGYESDRALLLWTVKTKLDTVATVCLRYNTYTQTWTEWEIPKRCAVLNSHQDAMYFGSAVDNYIEVERKNFDRFDYADRELAATMGDGALIGNSLYLSSSQFALLSVGDVFSQTQYVSITQFNSLLKQLDLDPLMPSTTFYSEIKLDVGADLNARMVELVAKLNTVDTWTGVDPNGNTSYQFVPNYNNYSVVQTQFNKIIDRLNSSPNAQYKNYLYSTGTKVYECYITELEVSTKRIGLNIAPAFMVGPLAIFKGIPVEIQYAPQHGGDPESFKQFSDGSFLFERRSFYSGQVAYNSDISDHFEEIPLFPNSSGVFGGATWGDGSTWGGLGDQANLRSYIPLKKQRCRFLGCKFIHLVALENFQLYGVSLSYRTYSINNRDYR